MPASPIVRIISVASLLTRSRSLAAVQKPKRLRSRDCTASRTFSATVSDGNRLVIWNERPMPA